MFDFNVTVEKTYNHRQRPGRTRIVEGTMRVQAETAEAAEAAALDVERAVVEWSEDVDRNQWVPSNLPFTVRKGETTQLAEVHPLTRATVLAWAEKYAADNPTVETRVWDDKEKAYTDGTQPNSARRVLANLLLSYFNHNQAGEKASELRESAANMAWYGTKGLTDYTIDEALNEIEENLIGDDASFDFATLEDLLTDLGPDSEYWFEPVDYTK